MDLKKETLKGYIQKLKENSKPIEGKEDEFGTVLAQLEVDGLDTVTNLGVARSEATSRKQSVRSFETQVEDQKLKIEELTTKVNADDPNKDELEKLRTFHTNTISNQRDTFKSFIDKVKDHANFEKASPDLKLPKANDKGEFDLTEMTQDELEHNVGEMTRFNRLELFGANGNGQVKKVEGSGPKKNIPEDLGTQIKGAKTQAELKAVQDSL